MGDCRSACVLSSFWRRLCSSVQVFHGLYFIKEFIDVAKSVTGSDFKVVMGERRDGDPARLVADSTLLQKELGWKPQYADLETIIRHAWEWEEKADLWAMPVS